MTADNYSIASGATLSAGCAVPSGGGGGGGGIPLWVPPSGYFADVPMMNDPFDVTPGIYGFSAPRALITFWTGSAILRDWGQYGAQVYYGAGHETGPTDLNLQMTLICDFNTLLWSIKNVPASANQVQVFQPTGGGGYPANLPGWPGDTTGGRPGYAPDGTPYNPHTYLGIQELPAAWGGGTKGSIVSFGFGGSNWNDRVNVIDPSQATGGYSQMTISQPASINADKTLISFGNQSNGLNISRGTYPTSDIDLVNQGWWLAPKNLGSEYLLFIHKNGSVDQYPAINGNASNAAMVLCPELGLLITIDGGVNNRALAIRTQSTGVRTSNTTLGTVPANSAGDYNPSTLGLQWVAKYGAIFGIDMYTDPANVRLVKLTPPPTNPATNPWTWSFITLAHWPSDTTGSTVLNAVTNTAWSKFRWVDALDAFTYTADNAATGYIKKPQVIRI